MLLRDPPPLPHWQSILYPYIGFVWAAVGGVVIITTIAYFFVNFWGLRLSLIESFLIVLQVKRVTLVIDILSTEKYNH